MKKLVIISIIALLTAAWSIARAQEYPNEYLGLPGDNLNLYAVMNLFQESETLEGFERSLNDENSMINNLDLNRDNMVDYIMVVDYVDGNVHNIVLRAALDRKETQDVAVFTVQRFSDGSAQIQLVGDEALYGRNYIIEPIYANNRETPNPGYMGNSANNRNVTVVRTTTYEIAAWPVVRYIYRPNYIVWRSSWYWGYYPSYWNPWRPFYWHTYYGYHYNWHNHYYAHYRTWNHHRYNRYNDFYYSRIRSYSPSVNVNIKVGKYKNTYSRPDLRKDGEVLYARRNSGQSVRTNQNTSVSRARSTGSANVQRSTARSNSGTEKRAVTSSNRRANTSSTVTQRTDAVRRSENTATDRNVKSTTAGRETKVTRRATATAPSGSSTSPAVKRAPATSKRTSPSVSTRTVSKTQAAPKARTARSSSSSPKSAVSSGSSSGRSGSSVTSGSSRSSSRPAATKSSSRTTSTGSSGRR